MITLLFSSTISLSTFQEIGGYITLIIDIIAALILLYKVIKANNITPKKVAKLVTTNKGKRKLAKIISEILKTLNNNEDKEDKK
jgi:hypothetical protein